MTCKNPPYQCFAPDDRLSARRPVRSGDTSPHSKLSGPRRAMQPPEASNQSAHLAAPDVLRPD